MLFSVANITFIYVEGKLRTVEIVQLFSAKLRGTAKCAKMKGVLANYPLLVANKEIPFK